MKSVSKFLLFLAFTCLALTSRGFSDDYYNSSTEPRVLYSGGLWVGGEFSSGTLGGWSLMAGYYNECFLADVGYSYQALSHEVHDSYNRIYFGRETVHFNTIRSHLGLRNRIYCTNLFLTYGGQGSVGIISSEWSRSNSIYEVGAFVGLDYQFSQHYMISGKIAPYALSILGGRDRMHRVFNSGSITIAYVF